MEFQNEFDVEAPIDDVWKAMLDLERVAPAMPGAEVLEKVDDDNYKVGIKVKVGPVSMQYRGDVQFTDKDESTHTATMNVKAREARGQGQATAKVLMKLSETGANATRGEMTADVQLSGKAASMGRGIIQDVSARLVQQFSNNLATMLAGPKVEEAPAEEPAAEAPAAEEPKAEEPAATAASNGSGEPTGDTVEYDAVKLEEAKGDSEAEPEPAPASGASAGGAGAAAAATKVAAEAPKAEAPPKPATPPKQASAEPAELDAMALGASIAKERAKNPVFLGIVGALILLWLLRRRR